MFDECLMVIGVIGVCCRFVVLLVCVEVYTLTWSVFECILAMLGVNGLSAGLFFSAIAGL